MIITVSDQYVLSPSSSSTPSSTSTIYPKMSFSQVGNKTTAPPPGQYDCWFDDSRGSTYTEVREASQCTENVTSIVLLGDSNGNNYAANLLHVLNNNGWVCSKTKVENAPKFQPDPMYYTRKPFIALADIQYEKRPCHGCSSFIAQCSFGNMRTLHFEYLGFPLFNDSIVTSNRTRPVTYHLNRTFSYDVVSSATQQQFIFNEYLAGRYPDVVIFFTSSHVRYSLNNIQPHAQFCFDTLDRYLPPTSLVILASAMKQQVTKKRFAGNLTGNDVQLLLNDGGYAGAQSRLADPNKRWYAFPNLFDHDLVGATGHMYKDHIHRTPIWYQSIMRFMLQLVCVL